MDVLVTAAHCLPNKAKNKLEEKGITIVNISRKVKRVVFSDISSSTKSRYKDTLLKTLMSAQSNLAADGFRDLLKSLSLAWATSVEDLKESSGITISKLVLPVQERIKATVETHDIKSIGHLKSPSKIVKVSLMNDSMSSINHEENNGPERGAIAAVALSFNVSFKSAKCLLNDTHEGKSSTDMVTRKKRRSITAIARCNVKKNGVFQQFSPG